MILSKNSQGELPYVQENGKVFSFTSKTDEQIKTLLVDPLNAKGYNISSSGWLEELTTLTKGDNVPNWDEYKEL